MGIIISFFFGAFIGMLIMAIVTISDDDDD